MQDGEFGLGKSKTYSLLHTLAKDFDNIQVIAISGRNQKIKRSFEYLVEKEHKGESIKVIDYTTRIPELMSISDLVITKPGRTYYLRKFSISVYQLLLLLLFLGKKKKMLHF